MWKSMASFLGPIKRRGPGTHCWHAQVLGDLEECAALDVFILCASVEPSIYSVHSLHCS